MLIQQGVNQQGRFFSLCINQDQNPFFRLSDLRPQVEQLEERDDGDVIAAHLHQHVVPRWPGDQNFMPIIGRTKTLPELLSDTRQLLADAWSE